MYGNLFVILSVAGEYMLDPFFPLLNKYCFPTNIKHPPSECEILPIRDLAHWGDRGVESLINPLNPNP